MRQDIALPFSLLYSYPIHSAQQGATGPGRSPATRPAASSNTVQARRRPSPLFVRPSHLGGTGPRTWTYPLHTRRILEPSASGSTAGCHGAPEPVVIVPVVRVIVVPDRADRPVTLWDGRLSQRGRATSGASRRYRHERRGRSRRECTARPRPWSPIATGAGGRASPNQAAGGGVWARRESRETECLRRRGKTEIALQVTLIAVAIAMG